MNADALGLRKVGGIVYNWICEEPFTEYCQSWNNSPVIQITPTVFERLGGKILNPYEFKLQTWSIESGMAPASTFNTTLRVEWKKLKAPEFTINIPEEGGSIYVTKESEIQIVLSNYKSTYQYLTYDYVFTPEVDISKIRWSVDNSALLIESSTFAFGTVYSLNVTISNSESGEAGRFSQEKKFTTEKKPTTGALLVTPNTGTMFETEFTITLSGFASENNPLSYAIYGVT